MRSPGISGEGELREQPANPRSPGKMAAKTECVLCVLIDVVSEFMCWDKDDVCGLLVGRGKWVSE